jgi:hypothetical protein
MHLNIRSSTLARSLFRGDATIKADRTQPGPPLSLPTVPSSKPAHLCLGMLCFLIASPQHVAAQPTIRTQPRNASVLLGQEAQFTVAAPGAASLTYQWRFDGQDLPGATNANLTVANVVLSSLGRYEVVVGDTGGVVTSAPAWLRLVRWTELVAFGRSDTSSGCAPQSWPYHLATNLGVRLRIYAPASGSAGTPSALVQAQIARYLSANIPTTNTLVATWYGGVDMIYFRSTASAEESAASQLVTTRMLVDAGARHILIPRLFPPELQPPSWADRFPSLTRESALQYDTVLDEGLEVLKAQHGVIFYRPDMFRFLTAVGENPSAYGFSGLLSALSCDGLHSNSPVHTLNAREIYRSLNPPLQIHSVARRPSGDIVLNWSGGSPPFRIEHTTDLLSGQWEPVGELSFVPNATVKPAKAHEFFRVVNLGQ